MITPKKDDNFRSLETMQQSAVNFKNFMGSRAYVTVDGDNPSRKELPFFRPEGEAVPLWTLLGKFIG